MSFLVRTASPVQSSVFGYVGRYSGEATKYNGKWNEKALVPKLKLIIVPLTVFLVEGIFLPDAFPSTDIWLASTTSDSLS